MRASGPMARDGLAVDPLGLLGIELDEGRRVIHLAPRLGQRLALLARHDESEILLVCDHQVEPPPHHDGALLGGLLGPGPEGRFGRLDRPRRLVGPEPGNAAQDLARGRIVDRIGGLADPGAAHEAAFDEKRRIVQFHHGLHGQGLVRPRSSASDGKVEPVFRCDRRASKRKEHGHRGGRKVCLAQGRWGDAPVPVRREGVGVAVGWEALATGVEGFVCGVQTTFSSNT